MRHVVHKVLLWLALIVLVLAYAGGLAAARGKILAGGADFISFYSAARIVHSGEGRALYDPATQQRAQSAWHSRPLPYYHPPFEVLLFLPLATLPFAQAYAAFMIANLTLLLLVAQLRHPLDLPGTLVLLPQLVACLAFYPVFLALLHGQDSILLLLLFSLAYLALRRDQDLRCGVWLGLALFKFQFVLPLLLVFTWNRRWKIVAGSLAVGMILGLVSIAIVGGQGTAEYPALLLEAGRSPGEVRAAAWMMPNLRGLTAAVLPEGPAGPLVIAALSVMLLGAGAWLGSQARAGDRTLDLVFAFYVVLALLVSYHLNGHDVSLMLLPVALIVRHLGAGRTITRIRRAAFVSLILALYYPPFLVPSATVPPAPIFWVMLLLAGTLFLEVKNEVRS